MCIGTLTGLAARAARPTGPTRLEAKPAEARPVSSATSQSPADLLVRSEKLTGATYKLRWLDSEHAFYVTINDVKADGVRRPFEIFINSKNLEHYAWVVALTRMISAVLRRGGDVSFIADELKQVFDPRGGQWTDRRYVPSLVAAIGEILERHMIDTGFLAIADPAVNRIMSTVQLADPNRYSGRSARNAASPGWSRKAAASPASIAAGRNAANGTRHSHSKA